MSGGEWQDWWRDDKGYYWWRYDVWHNEWLEKADPVDTRGASGSADFSTRFREDEKVLTFYPGHTGFRPNWNSGLITHVKAESQADKLGVKVGWRIMQIDGQPFSGAFLVNRINCGSWYALTFRTGSQEPYTIETKQVITETNSESDTEPGPPWSEVQKQLDSELEAASLLREPEPASRSREPEPASRLREPLLALTNWPWWPPSREPPPLLPPEDNEAPNPPRPPSGEPPRMPETRCVWERFNVNGMPYWRHIDEGICTPQPPCEMWLEEF